MPETVRLYPALSVCSESGAAVLQPSPLSPPPMPMVPEHAQFPLGGVRLGTAMALGTENFRTVTTLTPGELHQAAENFIASSLSADWEVAPLDRVVLLNSRWDSTTGGWVPIGGALSPHGWTLKYKKSGIVSRSETLKTVYGDHAVAQLSLLIVVQHPI